MATAPFTVRSQAISRDKLAEVFKDFATLKSFENMSQDVAVTIPAAVNGNTAAVVAAQATADLAIVNAATAQSTADTAILDAAAAQATADAAIAGPASATADAIVLFSGTSGKLAKNSGVLLNTLAPLASPAFTGTATAVNMTFSGLALTAASTTARAGLRVSPGVAPTAPVDGDIWATSAGVYAQVNGATETLVGGQATFSAHNNAVAQSIPNATTSKLTFSTEVFDIGSAFASSRWTPPAGRPVMLAGAVSMPCTLGTFNFVAVYKNGAEYKRGAQSVGGGASAEVLTVSCIDIPNGTDYYELWCRQTTGAAQNTFGDSHLTYFQGTTIRA